MDNTKWLLENAGYPIKYSLTRDPSYIGPMLENEEARAWLGRLTDRALCGNLSNIHGSHDYRYENIAGKCFILGLDANVPPLDIAMRFFIRFLEGHIHAPCEDKLTFGKIYQYRDYETLMACYLPLLGYAREPSVAYVAHKRANILYEFTRQKRYDIYRGDLSYPGANKAWKPYIVDPELYKDGNIALPSIHDMILLAGMYPHFGPDMKHKVETIVQWLFGEGYASINDSLYYYAPDDPRYKSKSVNAKIRLFDFEKADPSPGELKSLLFQFFIFSHFETAKNARWFSAGLNFLDRYQTDAGRYSFPKEMIAEQKDCCVYSGGHMNVGENKKAKAYGEILSTYWMERIHQNAR